MKSLKHFKDSFRGVVWDSNSIIGYSEYPPMNAFLRAYLDDRRKFRTIFNGVTDEILKKLSHFCGVGTNPGENSHFHLSMCNSYRVRKIGQRLSKQGAKCFDFDEELVPLSNLYKKIIPEDKKRISRDCKETIRNKKNFFYEFHIRSKQAGKRVLQVVGKPIYAFDGKIEKLIGSVQDMTDKKRIQERLLSENLIGNERLHQQAGSN